MGTKGHVVIHALGTTENDDDDDEDDESDEDDKNDENGPMTKRAIRTIRTTRTTRDEAKRRQTSDSVWFDSLFYQSQQSKDDFWLHLAPASLVVNATSNVLKMGGLAAAV